jgi:forkhead box protein N
MAPSKSLEESDANMRKRLVDSLSSSFPGSALSRALHCMEDDELSDDPLSMSCFAELRLEKGPPDEDDDELTSLAWLQDNDLLKNIRPGDESLCPSPTDFKENGDIKQENGGYSNQHPPNVPYNPQKHINSKPPYSFSCLIFMAIEDSPFKKLPVKDIYNWILTHFPYFQNAPTGWKNSVRHNLSLNKCFKKVDKEKGQSIGKGSLWCIDPDFRPNLLQALRKTPYHPYHQLQMLATPATANSSYTILPGMPKPLPLTAQRFNINTPSPHLFPFLSRRLAQTHIKVEPEDTEDIDVANTLVSLKRAAESARSRLNNGWSQRQRSRSPSPPEFGSERERQLLKRKSSGGHLSRSERPVITPAPSDDHTYSISSIPHRDSSPDPDSSIDGEYDFGPESDSCSDTSAESDMESDDEDMVETDHPAKRRKQSKPSPLRRRLVIAEDDEDEKMKIVEGADALLNLAGIKTRNIVPLRSLSPSTNNNNNNNNNENTKTARKGKSEA